MLRLPRSVGEDDRVPAVPGSLSRVCPGTLRGESMVKSSHN